ncbi:hypothetical protein F4801DRAFT_567379 [Xylaria longipes]|nr:hypothetical protein F4801DRAFT_567379 [Xylaria longipes]
MGSVPKRAINVSRSPSDGTSCLSLLTQTQANPNIPHGELSPLSRGSTCERSDRFSLMQPQISDLPSPFPRAFSPPAAATCSANPFSNGFASLQPAIGKPQNFGLGNGSPAGSPTAERVAFEPTAENYHDMSTYCEQMGRHQDAKQYAHMAKHRVRMDRSVALKGGGQYIQNAEATSIVVKTNAKARIPFRASREEMISSRSSSENQFAPGSLEGGKTGPEEKPYETESNRCPFSIPVVHQPEVRQPEVRQPKVRQPKARLRGIAVNNEATPDAKGFYGYGQSPTNTSPYEVKWNYEAFPCADQGLMAKVLIEGGQSTMKLSRTGSSNDAYPLLLYDAATSKALLKQDQWAIDNPTEFELQWAFVEKLILDWHRDLRLRLEKLRSGELKALEMLEGAFSLRAMVQGIPQGSFWVFWVVGMRQALQGPVFN